jgi:hypothetical protein
MVEILWRSYTKGRVTVNTNIDLTQRASSRPYLRGTGGEVPPVYSPSGTRRQVSPLGLACREGIPAPS